MTVLMFIVLAGCTGGPAAPSDPSGPIEGSWQLDAGSINGAAIPLVDGRRVTLVIEGSEIGGVAACNHYGGRLVAAAGGVRIEALSQTEMGCEEPAMASEAAYLGALAAVRTIGRDGNELVLAGPGVELRFAALPPPPTAELIDTVWHLDGLISGEAVAAPMGEPATLEVRSDGTFSGSTGCRAFSGEWIENGDQIDTPSWGMDETECPAALQGQDRHVVEVIEAGFIPSIEGARLTLMDQNGDGLVYRAEE